MDRSTGKKFQKKSDLRTCMGQMAKVKTDLMWKRGGEGREWTDKYWQIRICKRKCWGNQRKNYSSSWSKKATEVLNRDSRHRVGRTQERQEVPFRLLLSPLVSPGSSEWIFSFLQLFNIESVEFSWNPLNSVGTGCNLLEGLCAAVHCLANVLFFFFLICLFCPVNSPLSSFLLFSLIFYFCHKPSHHLTDSQNLSTKLWKSIWDSSVKNYLTNALSLPQTLFSV